MIVTNIGPQIINAFTKTTLVRYNKFIALQEKWNLYCIEKRIIYEYKV